MENNKQTAVEWLVSQLNKQGFAKVVTDEEIQKAKEMEKEQIIKAVYDSMETNFDPNMGRAELYYNEVYGNKTADT